MDRVRKMLPAALLFSAIAIGGMSVAQTGDEGSSLGGDKPKCNCTLPNHGTYGLLEDDPNNPGEKRCQTSNVVCEAPGRS
ncbi:MAG: hypothetical protein AAGM22_08075 [Acidobacteriota bacterium]